MIRPFCSHNNLSQEISENTGKLNFSLLLYFMWPYFQRCTSDNLRNNGKSHSPSHIKKKANKYNIWLFPFNKWEGQPCTRENYLVRLFGLTFQPKMIPWWFKSMLRCLISQYQLSSYGWRFSQDIFWKHDIYHHTIASSVPSDRCLCIK